MPRRGPRKGRARRSKPLSAQDVAAASRRLGEGRPQAARAADAAGRERAAGRSDLRRRDRVARDVARPRRRRRIRIPGRTATIRRLTRTEYQNAIRDLLALDVDVASLLPADESSYGFDNVTVGDLSPTLLDRYVSAAEKISRLAVGRPSRSPGGETIRVPAGPHAGRAHRRPADRHARRRAGALHVSAGRRVRDPDSADARSRRARRRAERAARSRTARSTGSACSCSP